MRLVVLNDWVTLTKLTLRGSKRSTIRGSRERTGEPVDLIDDHHIDLPGVDVGEQTLECRAPHASTRASAIIVKRGNRLPAFVCSNLHVSIASLVLGIDAVERLIEPFIGALAALLDERGFEISPGTAEPGDYVIERAFAEKMTRLTKWMTDRGVSITK